MLSGLFAKRNVAPVSPPPSPTRDDPKTPQPRLSAAGSIMRIRLSVDHSTPPRILDDDITMANRTDSRSQTQVRLGAVPATTGSLSRPPTTMVFVRRSVFNLVWLAFLTLHIVVSSYIVTCASLFSSLPARVADDYAFSLLTTIPVNCFALFAVGLALMALFHVIAALHMLIVSIAHRQLAFRSQRSWKAAFEDLLKTVEAAKPQFRPQSMRDASMRMERPSASQSLSSRLALKLHDSPRGKRLLERLRVLFAYWDQVMGRDGVLGIDSEYFDIVVFTRKFLMLSFQTYQAYMGSFYLSNRRLNNFLVFTVVMHCIATPAIHFYFQQRHAPMERVLYLASCLSLTFGCFVVPPMYLLKSLNERFLNVQPTTYFDDGWLIHTVRDLQFLVVDGAMDVSVAFVPLVVISLCMSAIKPMLGRASSAIIDIHSLQSATATAPRPSATLALPGRRTGSNYASGSIAPDCPRGSSVSPDLGPVATNLEATLESVGEKHVDDQDDEGDRRGHSVLAQGIAEFTRHHVVEEQQTQSRQFREQHYPITGMKLHAGYVFFLIWAAIVLSFHVRASRTSQQSRQLGCQAEIRPWSTHRYACAVLEYNCVLRGSNGSDLETALLKLHRRSLTTLMISHCTAVKMPPSIQVFPNLIGIKLYNSTLASWPVGSALTDVTHPKMSYVVFIRTILKAPGHEIVSNAVSPTVKRLVFTATNASTLFQVDFGMKWLHLRMLLVENTHLSQFPRAIGSLTALEVLSLGWNNITELPAGTLMGMRNLEQLSFASNQLLSVLPETLAIGSNLKSLDVSDTSVAKLPSWIRPSPSTIVQAHGSPLCATASGAVGIACEASVGETGLIYPLVDEDTRFALPI